MATLTTFRNPNLENDFIVVSQPMQDLMAMVERVALNSGTVLVVGETGTGKERIAHAVHQYSLRSKQPFIDINCAALPEHLVESELFGYEKGAFSGADAAKPGLFELAHMGTIFLDEIGELDLKVQVKLLRILDQAPFYRLGGNRKVAADVRVVAATNRDLKEEVRSGRFRKDLYHRLCQFELKVPPLRERPDDILALADHLLMQRDSMLKFSQDALEVLLSYSWPGNVRELQNAINKVIFAAAGPQIEAFDVRQVLTNGDVGDSQPGEFPRPANGLEEGVASWLPSRLEGHIDDHLDRLKAQSIQRALEKTGGHRGQAAVELGISRRTLSRKLRDLGFIAGKVAATDTHMLDKDRQSFRAVIKVLATLVAADGAERTCTTTNLSADGIGLEGVESLPGRGLRVRFALPNSGRPLDIAVRVAWDDKQGAVGLIFTDVDAVTRREIRFWLDQKMEEEACAAVGYPAPASVSACTPDRA